MYCYIYYMCYSLLWLGPIIKLFMHWGLQSTWTIYCERWWDFPYRHVHTHTTGHLYFPLKPRSILRALVHRHRWVLKEGQKNRNLMTHKNDKHVHLSHGSTESQMFESSVSKRFAEHTNLMRRMTENNQGVFWTWRQRRPGILGFAGNIQSAGWTRFDSRGIIGFYSLHYAMWLQNLM